MNNSNLILIQIGIKNRKISLRKLVIFKINNKIMINRTIMNKKKRKKVNNKNNIKVKNRNSLMKLCNKKEINLNQF